MRSRHASAIRTQHTAIALALWIVTLAACGSPTRPSPATGPFSVSGTVRDAGTGNVSVGVRVGFQPDGQAAVDTVSDSTGHYSVQLNGNGSPLVATITIGDRYAGEVTIGGVWRGDLLGGGDGCVARYGQVVDASTGRPISGATVSLVGQQATTAADGWYRIDLGCPPGGVIGFNTTFIEASAQNYTTFQRVVGRGVANVDRLDLALSRR